MGAVDFQTLLWLSGKNCCIYAVTAVPGLLDRMVLGCQEDCSPIPSSGHCLPSHPQCYVNKGQSTENLLRPLISWLTGAPDPANLQLLMLSAFPISPCSCKSSICLQLFKWLFQLFHICFPIRGNCFSHHPSAFPTPSHAPRACHTTCLSPFLLLYSLSHKHQYIWAPLQLLIPPSFLSPSILHDSLPR